MAMAALIRKFSSKSFKGGSLGEVEDENKKKTIGNRSDKKEKKEFSRKDEIRRIEHGNWSDLITDPRGKEKTTISSVISGPSSLQASKHLRSASIDGSGSSTVFMEEAIRDLHKKMDEFHQEKNAQEKSLIVAEAAFIANKDDKLNGQSIELLFKKMEEFLNDKKAEDKFFEEKILIAAESLTPTEIISRKYDRWIRMVSTRINFTGDSAATVTRILIDEAADKSKKKKLIYVHCCIDGATYAWATIDANYGLLGEQVSVSLSLSDDVIKSDDLLPTHSFGCTSWGSKILIVGGKRNCKSSDKVFIYDITSKTWVEFFPMKKARGNVPRVVVMDNKIYVFGGCLYYDQGENLESHTTEWAEVYDGNTWEYLPDIAPESLVRCEYCISSHAVYKESILFWVLGTGIYIYDFENKSWSHQMIIESLMLEYPDSVLDVHHPPSISLCHGPTWSCRVAVVGDFIFWHFYGIIYGHDLNTNTTLPLYCVKDHSRGSHCGYLAKPRSTYLVYVGHGKLCLFSRHHKQEQSNFPFLYHIFLIVTTMTNGKCTLSLVEQCSGTVDMDIRTMGAVMEVEV